jgi:2-C-methyl-D-erythritol 2,4-cyclodiphosphate synthase
LYLGGIFFPSQPGLKGHSDADVVLHAVCDSLLGAAGLGDIGEHFPDTDKAYKEMQSSFFLKKVVELLADNGYMVGNIDVMVLAEKPKINPHKPKMREIIARICGVEQRQISLKATTTERLGFVGREEGIAAYCVALIKNIEDKSCQK